LKTLVTEMPITIQENNNEIVIKKLSIELERNSHFDTKVTETGVNWFYSETLELDHNVNLLTIRQNYGIGCHVIHQYFVQSGMDGLLLAAQSCISDSGWVESQAFEDDTGICFYRLTAELYDDTVITHMGQYNRSQMPEKPWLELIDCIQEFVSFYGFGQLLSANDFMNASMPGDIKYCSIEFAEFGITFYYQTDDDTIGVGDSVVVPFGKNNNERLGVVKVVGYFHPEHVPFPLDRTKKIIKKIDVDTSRESISVQNKYSRKLKGQDRKKHPAIVRFVGNPENYRQNKNGNERVSVLDQPLQFDRDGYSLNKGPIFSHEIENNGNPIEYVNCFNVGTLYPAYFLEFWQGERSSLHVKNNLDEITGFNQIEDFEIIEDLDHVLNKNEAIVRCSTHKFDGKEFSLNYGKEYIAIGVTDKQFSDLDYLVMDESSDCYFYSSDYFEIVRDPFELLDKSNGQYVYDWASRFESQDPICPVCEKHLFDEPDDFDICPICGWENDGLQRDQRDYWGGANDLSVNESKIVHSLLRDKANENKVTEILDAFKQRHVEIMFKYRGIDYRTEQGEKCISELSQSHRDFISELEKLLETLL
jgi:hypothetical protein